MGGYEKNFKTRLGGQKNLWEGLQSLKQLTLEETHKDYYSCSSALQEKTIHVVL